jgi:DNA repair photolyase
MENRRPQVRGRGSQLDPPNRFEATHHVPDLEQVEHDAEYLDALARRKTETIPDRARSIVTENDSPDVGFRYSVNPYRGCEHGCAYCFARPSHEFLGFNAGLDFETKILVKEDAPELFRAFLSRRSWEPAPIAMAPNTDAYQPLERRLKLARRVLEVAAECRQPMAILTKNALVVRDLDLLGPMAAEGVAQVNVSLTTLDADLARTLEPRTSTPEARLRAIRALSAAGVPVRVLVAPVIPGLTDDSIPAVLKAVQAAGALSAEMGMIRLPLAVAPVFLDWLDRHQPGRRARVEGRIRAMRDGKLNDSTFGERMTGRGAMAEGVRALFRVTAAKLGLDAAMPPLATDRFRRPGATPGQLWLF